MKDAWKRDRRGQSSISSDDFKNWVLGIWQFLSGESARRIGHEAPFPRELPRRCIQLFCLCQTSLVLDPFVGSGTTMIEAIQGGRQTIGIEIEPRYVELARQRVAAETEVELTVDSGTGKKDG